MTTKVHRHLLKQASGFDLGQHGLFTAEGDGPLLRVSAAEIFKTAYDINLTLLDNHYLNPAAFSYSEFERCYFPKE